MTALTDLLSLLAIVGGYTVGATVVSVVVVAAWIKAREVCRR